MLNTEARNEIVEGLLDASQLSPEARAAVQHIRKQQPSRKTRSGTHNVATRYASRKMGCVIQAEAQSTELAAVYEWDHDQQTAEFYDQPPAINKIFIKRNGKQAACAYTPDYFLIQKGFIGWVECKAEEWLRTRSLAKPEEYYLDENGVWRCPPAERYAESVGLRFLVRSTAESDPIVTKNIADFSDYWDERCPEPPENEAALVRAQFHAESFLWLQDLLALAPAVSADTIYSMIAREELFVDMRSSLVMAEPYNTRVFRSLAAWDTSRLYLSEQTHAPEFNLHPVQLILGEALRWNGSDWRIANLTDTHVSVTNQAGDCSTLSRQSFMDRISQGEIIGCGAVEDSRQSMGNEILRKASRQQHEAALKRYYALFPERATEPVEKVSERTLRNIRRAFEEGERTYGNGFVGLIPKFHLRGDRREKIDPAVREMIRESLEKDLARKTRVPLTTTYGEVLLRCKEDGMRPPSEKTFRLDVKRFKSPHDLEKARAGRKAAYRFEMPYILERTTPRHGTRPFEIGHIDHTQLDLQFVDRQFGRQMGKAWLSILMDAYDREILAWYVSFDEPSHRTLMMLIRKCVRKHHRIPDIIITDNGSDMRSTYFETLIAYLGSHQKFRPKSKSRFGSPIERFFGINNTEFVHALHGNNQALQVPRSMSPTHDPRNLAIWNLKAFDLAFESYLSNVYHVSDHPALGVSPLAARALGLAQSGMRSHRHFPYTLEFEILTMPGTPKGIAKVQDDGGIQINYLKYYNPILSEPKNIGQSFDVRFDPFDVSRAFVRAGNEWLLCKDKHAGLFNGRSLKEIAVLSDEIMERNKAASRTKADFQEMLAMEMRRVRVQEEQLKIDVQRARDLERMGTDGPGILDTSDTHSNAQTDGPITSDFEPTDTLTLFTIETYGDFK